MIEETIVLSGNKASEELLKGIKLTAETVGLTLGYRGKNVLVPKGYSNKLVPTKDGVTVAKSINISKDKPGERAGSELVKAVAEQMLESVGDGTTTAVTLYYKMCSLLSEHIFAGSDKRDLAEGALQAKNDIVKFLEKQIITILPDDKKLQDVAIISSNSNEIGEQIAQMMKKIGSKGIINVQDSGSIHSEFEYVDGMELSHGYKDKKCINNIEKEIVEFNNAKVLVVDKKLESYLDVQKVIELIEKDIKDAPLLIIAQEITGLFEDFLRVNFIRKTIKACPIKIADSEILQDIATFVGATTISSQSGAVLMENLTGDCLGSVGKATVTNKSTILVKGGGDQRQVDQRIDLLKAQIENKNANDINIKSLERRIFSLTALVCNYKVGGFTELEQKEKRDRVEDASRAAKAALEDGVVPGGFSCYVGAYDALLSTLDSLKRTHSLSYIAGYKAILESLLYSITLALSHGGLLSQSQVIIHQITEALRSNNKNFAGFDLKSFTIKNNMIEAGIVDPAKAVIEAIKISCDHVVQGFVLSEAIILEKPDTNKQQNDFSGMY